MQYNLNIIKIYLALLLSIILSFHVSAQIQKAQIKCTDSTVSIFIRNKKLNDSNFFDKKYYVMSTDINIINENFIKIHPVYLRVGLLVVLDSANVYRTKLVKLPNVKYLYSIPTRSNLHNKYYIVDKIFLILEQSSNYDYITRKLENYYLA